MKDLVGDAEVVVVYHKNCLDGYTAAWVARTKLGDGPIAYVPCGYGDDTSDVVETLTGKEVYILDFSFPRTVTEQLCEVCKKLIVLDHHKTAEENLRGLQPKSGYIVFDTERSGAMLAWAHLFGPYPPRLVQHVQDRDLWRFVLPETRAVTAYLSSQLKTFKTWDRIHQELELSPSRVLVKGEAILDYQREVIEEHKRAQFSLRLVVDEDSYVVPAVFCSDSTILSELVGGLAESHPFALGIIPGSKGLMLSFRSREGGEDVSLIAKRMGGGGHKHAAGVSRFGDYSFHVNEGGTLDLCYQSNFKP